VSENVTANPVVTHEPDSQHDMPRRVMHKNGWKFADVIFPAAGGTVVKTFENSPMWRPLWASADPAP
jgi:hypothetical protein